MGTVDNRELSIISDSIVQLDKRGELSVSNLLDMCRMYEVEVTYNKLQQLNRSKLEGRMPIKILRRDLMEQLQPFGYLDGVHEVLAKVDFPESEEELRSNAVSISLMTPSMLKVDADYFSDPDQLLKIIYTPYCYQFTAFSPDESDPNTCYFEQVQNLVKEHNGGDDSLWFKGLLYSPNEKVENKDDNTLLHGVLEYTEGKTFQDEDTQGEAYLRILREPVPSEVISFYSIESILQGYNYGTANQAINAIFNPGKNCYGGNGSNKRSPDEKESPSSRSSYKVKIYNTGAGNCIYLYPSEENLGQYHKRFFFDIGKTMYSRFKINRSTKSYILGSKDMQRLEVNQALRYISSCQPDFIILSHWDKDHYNLAYRLRRQLSTCPWIAPQIESRYKSLPLNTMRLVKYLCANHLVHFVGSGDINKQISANSVFSLWRGKSAKSIIDARYDDRNADCLLLQMSQTLLPADCTYPNWPDHFAEGQTFQHFIVPHHGSKFIDPQTGCFASSLWPCAQAALNQTGNVYVCAGEDRAYHPSDLHMNLLDKHLCTTSTGAGWKANCHIQSTKDMTLPSTKWDDK